MLSVVKENRPFIPSSTFADRERREQRRGVGPPGCEVVRCERQHRRHHRGVGDRRRCRRRRSASARGRSSRCRTGRSARGSRGRRPGGAGSAGSPRSVAPASAGSGDVHANWWASGVSGRLIPTIRAMRGSPDAGAAHDDVGGELAAVGDDAGDPPVRRSGWPAPRGGPARARPGSGPVGAAPRPPAPPWPARRSARTARRARTAGSSRSCLATRLPRGEHLGLEPPRGGPAVPAVQLGEPLRRRGHLEAADRQEARLPVQVERTELVARCTGPAWSSPWPSWPGTPGRARARRTRRRRAAGPGRRP